MQLWSGQTGQTSVSQLVGFKPGVDCDVVLIGSRLHWLRQCHFIFFKDILKYWVARTPSAVSLFCFVSFYPFIYFIFPLIALFSVFDCVVVIWTLTL